MKATDPAHDTDADGGPDLPHVPLVQDAIETPIADVKPTWRGWIHAGTFPVAIALGVILIVFADGVAAKVSSAIYVLCSLLLFGNSALYHRLNWKPRTKLLLRRIDHSNIFLLIAGTYTPLAVLALPQPKQTILLSIIWGGAGLGILFRIFFIRAPRWLYVPLYLALGFGAFIFIVDFFNANAVMMTLVLIGGAFYTAGAIGYALKKPNPFPGKFGFHEIFHSCTLVAFLCHWVGIFLIAINPPVFA